MTTYKQTLGVGSRLAITLDHGLRDTLDKLRARAAWRRAYVSTRDELSCLTDRDLADLGIARGNIPALAREAADMLQAAR